MDEGLGESHRRVIGSGMLVVDAAAVRMLNLLENRNSPVVMRVVEGSVEEDERDQIRAGLKQLQSLIAAFVKKYNVQPSKKNLRRILASDLSQIWVTLEDSRPARIRGYGAMLESVSESLESDLQEMLALVNRMAAALKT